MHKTSDVLYSEESRDSYLHNDLLVTGVTRRAYDLINFILEGQGENFRNTLNPEGSNYKPILNRNNKFARIYFELVRLNFQLDNGMRFKVRIKL